MIEDFVAVRRQRRIPVIGLFLGDGAELAVRQVEQLRRVVARESQQTAVRAAQEFDTTIRAAREEAARRLARQLDIAVERFARDAEAVDATLAGLKAVCRSGENVMPALIEACRALATEGEIVDAMAEVFGRYVERASF